ncbi:hypothetical protein [Aulosira sp. FACHB-615]|uniref:hypothetical protein n=1 Tax=Aulosira sp. FACHB-615 TaxID=2692777 RepID=UPI00168581BB|nr:hypothetical protein [Aulosira sp. FACHB-615]MBD2488995.1 hypothetical protein [Aulosira sp. FACHB-615]
MKSCLNCVHGSFWKQEDHHLYYYTGECEHWEKAIREQAFDAIEIGSEDPAELEQPFKQIGEQCPVWEVNS